MPGSVKFNASITANIVLISHGIVQHAWMIHDRLMEIVDAPTAPFVSPSVHRPIRVFQ